MAAGVDCRQTHQHCLDIHQLYACRWPDKSTSEAEAPEFRPTAWSGRHLKARIAAEQLFQQFWGGVSAKLGRFCPHYALNLFRKLVDSTRTIYNTSTAILFIDGNGNLLFRFHLLFPCCLPSWCRLPAICLLSACYLPISCRLPTNRLFIWSL